MKSVKISDLKAKLSMHLREVQGGETLTVMDRNVPIARIVPFVSDMDGLVVRPRKGDHRKIALPPAVKAKFDVVADLVADRDRDRRR